LVRPFPVKHFDRTVKKDNIARKKRVHGKRVYTDEGLSENIYKKTK
jgi:hypothetical protein